jgi:serine/threonine-protein kinase HipA
MAIVDSVTVYYEAFAIGIISVMDQGQMSFTYDPRWLATKGAFPLSVTMPLQADPFADTVIGPWLANLLPEEQQLLALTRVLGLSSSDSLAILREIGGDTAGAISIGEPNVRADWHYEPLRDHYRTGFDEQALVQHFDDLGRRPFLVGEDGVRLSLAGGQKKTALAVLDANGRVKLGLPQPGDTVAIPKFGAPSTLIIKPDNPTLPGIVENEAYCLTLARLIGLPAVEAVALKAGNRSALAVARYDRTRRNNGSLRRLHQEDLAQANGIYPGQKYERGTVPGLTLNSLLQTGRSLPPGDALLLLDQVIYNILVANTDAHAKNYSMLLSVGARMAPLYDVSSVLPWDHVVQYHAQNLAGRKRKPGDMARRHWDRIAEEAGFNSRNLRLRVQEQIDEMVARRVEATDLVSMQPGVSAEMVRHVAELAEQNALRIGGRLRAKD